MQEYVYSSDSLRRDYDAIFAYCEPGEYKTLDNSLDP